MSDFQTIGKFQGFGSGNTSPAATSVAHDPWTLIGDGAQPSPLVVHGIQINISGVTFATYFASNGAQGAKPGQFVRVPQGGGIDLAIATSASNGLAVGCVPGGDGPLTIDSPVWNGSPVFYAFSDGYLNLTAAQWQAVTDEGTALQAGKQYYLSASNAGNITITAPGDVISIGIALSSTELLVRIGYPIVPS